MDVLLILSEIGYSVYKIYTSSHFEIFRTPWKFLPRFSLKSLCERQFCPGWEPLCQYESNTGKNKCLLKYYRIILHVLRELNTSSRSRPLPPSRKVTKPTAHRRVMVHIHGLPSYLIEVDSSRDGSHRRQYEETHDEAVEGVSLDLILDLGETYLSNMSRGSSV